MEPVTRRLGLLVGAVALVSLASVGAADDASRPNVVLMIADDLGYSDLGCYGATRIETPHLDRLAEEGLRFTQFHNVAKCTQTRASLLTGLYHQQTNNLRRADNNVTLAEALGNAGYTTLMAGKWHLGNARNETNTPTKRGFDRAFGFLGGAINYYTGKDFGSGNNYMRLDGEVYEPGDDFYATDAFTDRAIQFVNGAAKKDSPFFLYLAYNAPHFPLQVPREDIEKYRGRFMLGWDALRRERHENMVEMGLVEPRWELTARDPKTPAWESLGEERKRREDHLMATYAAMVDRMDRNIGRLMDRLESLGVSKNTIVIFLSDNGGCPYDFNHTPTRPPGPASSRRTYDVEWAQASNTPFRLYKQYEHEGGSATPFIVRWPETIEAGRVVDQPAHVIDVVPTLLEVAGVEYPSGYEGRDVLPLEGESLAPILRGKESIDRGPIYWEYRGSRAVRHGKWKLVGERGRPWELYDMAADRTETNNLAEEKADRAARMKKRYDRWAKRVGARTTEQAKSMGVNTQDRYLTKKERRRAKKGGD